MELVVEENEDDGHELEPRVEGIAAELEPVAVDLDRVVVVDGQDGAGGVGVGPRRARNRRVAQLGDQVEVQRERRALGSLGWASMNWLFSWS